MNKSEKLMAKLNRAEALLEQVRQLVEFVIDSDENGDGCSAGKFMKTCDDLTDLIGDLGYEICMPMQMEEMDTLRGQINWANSENNPANSMVA